ncbi:phasin family protein [Cupriavidus basilensis]
MEATNAVGASTRKLFDFVKQNRLDPAAILESRRKDIEAIASVNATLLAGLQSLVRQQAEFLTDTTAELQSLALRGRAADGQPAAKVAEVLPRSLHKAVAGLRGLTDTRCTRPRPTALPRSASAWSKTWKR